jgi:dCTP diphosphatase
MGCAPHAAQSVARGTSAAAATACRFRAANGVESLTHRFCLMWGVVWCGVVRCGVGQLVGEVGELAELFQWRPDAECAPGLSGWTDAQRTHLGEEVSDVLLYLVQLADVCEVDLVEAVPRKMAMNGRKYPSLEAVVKGGEAAGAGGCAES